VSVVLDSVIDEPPYEFVSVLRDGRWHAALHLRYEGLQFAERASMGSHVLVVRGLTKRLCAPRRSGTGYELFDDRHLVLEVRFGRANQGAQVGMSLADVVPQFESVTNLIDAADQIAMLLIDRIVADGENVCPLDPSARSTRSLALETA
jgi:hypothetical protein